MGSFAASLPLSFVRGTAPILKFGSGAFDDLRLVGVKENGSIRFVVEDATYTYPGRVCKQTYWASHPHAKRVDVGMAEVRLLVQLLKRFSGHQHPAGVESVVRFGRQ